MLHKLWPHLDEGSRRFELSSIAGGEDWFALAGAIQDCYLLGYRIPEDVLQELEQGNEDWNDPDEKIYRLFERYIAQVRSLDEKQ